MNDQRKPAAERRGFLKWKPRRLVAGFLFVFIAASFLTLPRNPLQNDDAATYTLAAKNAILHNQWLVQLITPGDPSSFLDKPPLGVWLLAWIPRIAGVSELTVHIPNLFYYCLFLAVLYFGIAKLANRGLAFYSVLIAATSLCLIAYSRTPKLEVILALFVMAAHFSLFAFLKKNNAAYLYLFTLFCALGFLVKTGLGILFPALTALSLLAASKETRNKLFGFIFSFHSVLCLLLFLVVVGSVLGAQSLILKDQWLPYLKSLFIQSKYNSVPILGFGFYYPIIGLLLITIFPWTPLFLSGCTRRSFLLSRFCVYWFWSNFLFLLFFYRQTDFRTFTALVPPMAILAGIRLRAIFWSTREPRGLLAGSRVLILWNTLFLAVFAAALVMLLINPVNAQGINLSAAIFPIALFVLSLALLTLFYLKSRRKVGIPTEASGPSLPLWALCFALVALSYSILFYNTKPLADAFNPDVKWPGIIKEYQQKGYQFYIYRPPDRNLSFSPDLLYVDFIAGPANQYFWDGSKLLNMLKRNRAVILSDTKSWEKLNFKGGKTIARDSYSSLILTPFIPLSIFDGEGGPSEGWWVRK